MGHLSEGERHASIREDIKAAMNGEEPPSSRRNVDRFERMEGELRAMEADNNPHREARARQVAIAQRVREAIEEHQPWTDDREDPRHLRENIARIKLVEKKLQEGRGKELPVDRHPDESKRKPLTLRQSIELEIEMAKHAPPARQIIEARARRQYYDTEINAIGARERDGVARVLSDLAGGKLSAKEMAYIFDRNSNRYRVDRIRKLAIRRR